jgi:hypothetical protein
MCIRQPIICDWQSIIWLRAISQSLKAMCNKVFPASKGINLENSQTYGLILVEAAELHNMNGAYRVAREYLEQAKRVLEGGDFMKDVTKGRYELALAETLTGQGYYTQAIELVK